MKPNKTIFLIISAVFLIAITGYAKQIINDKSLASLFPDQDNEFDINDFILNNVSLFIDDREVIKDSQRFLASPRGEDSSGSPGQKIQAGSWVMDFGRDGTYEFVFKFINKTHEFNGSTEEKASYTIDMEVFSTDNPNSVQINGLQAAQYNSSNNIEPWPPLNINSTPFPTVISDYTNDTNSNNNFKSNLANNSLESDVDVDRLVAKLDLLNIKESGAKVNLLWKFSYNSNEPFVMGSYPFENNWVP